MVKLYSLVDMTGVMVSGYYYKRNYEMTYVFNARFVLQGTVQYLRCDRLQTMIPVYLN